MLARHAIRMHAVIRRSLSTMTSTARYAGQSTSMDSQDTSCFAISSVLTSSAHNAPHVPIPRNGVDYRNKIVLAPMVRSGELPSRLLALHYGADLVWGPETVDKAMIGTTERKNSRTGCIEWTRVSNNAQQPKAEFEQGKENVIFRIDPAREKAKFIYQIGTASPTLAVQAASLVAPYCSGIDVNAGCPKPFSTCGGMGAALLRTPDLLCSILTALVKEVGQKYEIGISVKIRLLETRAQTSELVNRLCKTGITGLTIHCRTTPMRPRERAIREQLHMIGDICRSHGVACLMNGDVASRKEGVALAEEFDVDGAMIATAAEANSSVFRTEEEGGLVEWKAVVKQYLKFAMGVENKFGNTKFLLSQLMPGKSPAYQPITMSRSHVEILAILEIQENEMIKSAQAVDELLGLNKPRVTRKDIKKERRDQDDQKRKAKQERQILCGDANQNHAQHKKQKAEAAAENAGFGGVGEGAMAVAV